MKRDATAVERLWAYLRRSEETGEFASSKTAFILLFTDAVNEVAKQGECECR